MTVGIILLNTPLFIRESKSAIGAVRAEILRQAPECEMLQLTDEIVIFDQSEKVTESALRRGLDVWNVQLRKREERRAKEEAVYREDIYRSAAWRARMTAWLEGQEKKVQRREEVEDGRRGRDYRLRGRTGNSRGSLEEEEEGDTPPEEGGIAPPPWSPRRHLHPPRKEIPLPPPLSTLNSHNTQVLLSRSLYLHVQNAVFSGGRVSLWRGWCTRSCASRGERNNRKTNILRYINRLDTTSTT